MSNYLDHLNKILFDIREDLSIDAIKEFLTLEDIKEFFKKIGYEWKGNYCYDSTVYPDKQINNLNQLSKLLSTEINDDENNIYKDKNALVFELKTNDGCKDAYTFYISPYIFYHKSNTYHVLLSGKTIFFDADYSKKWIIFLLAKYGKQYANAISKQLKKGLETTNNKSSKDAEDLSTLTELIFQMTE